MAPRLRCLSTVYGPGCLPGHRDYLTRHDSPGFDAGRLLRPLVPRERSRSLARPPPAVFDVHHARDWALGASGSIRPRRPSIERHGASVPTRVHLPPQLRNTRVSRKLRFGTWASPSTSYGGAPAPDFHRLSGLTSLSGWLPTTPPQGGSHMAATIAPAPKRHQRNFVSTLAAAARKADLAARHYPVRANPHPQRRPGSDGRHARRAAPEPASAGQRARRIAPAASLRSGPRGSRAGALSAPSAGSVAAPAERQAGLGPHSRGRSHGPRSASLRALRPFVPSVLTAPGASSGSAARRRPPESRRSPVGRVHANAAGGASGRRRHPHRVGLDGCVGRSGRTRRARAVRRAPRGGGGRARCGAHGVARGLSPGAEFR